jgi:CarD family transcriptional regulator
MCAGASRRAPTFGRRCEAIEGNTMQAMVDEGTGSSAEFQVGEMAVHPAHGVGQVKGIETRDLGGSASRMYVLNIQNSGLKVLVPTEAAARVGLRPVMSSESADEILTVLAAPEVAVDVQPWNRRFRAYTDMIKSGLPTEIAKVLRDMYRLKFDKDLSFGERRLLDQARSLLIEELALAQSVERTAIEARIEAIFAS